MFFETLLRALLRAGTDLVRAEVERTRIRQRIQTLRSKRINQASGVAAAEAGRLASERARDKGY